MYRSITHGQLTPSPNALDTVRTNLGLNPEQTPRSSSPLTEIIDAPDAPDDSDSDMFTQTPTPTPTLTPKSTPIPPDKLDAFILKCNVRKRNLRSMENPSVHEMLECIVLDRFVKSS